MIDLLTDWTMRSIAWMDAVTRIRCLHCASPTGDCHAHLSINRQRWPAPTSHKRRRRLAVQYI